MRSTCRCHSESPLTANRHRRLRYSLLRKPYHRSLHYHQSLLLLLDARQAFEKHGPYPSLQRCSLMNGQYQKHRIHFQSDVENLPSHRIDARFSSARDDLSKSYGDNFDDPHPTQSDLPVCQIRNAKRWTIPPFPSWMKDARRFERRNPIQTDATHLPMPVTRRGRVFLSLRGCEWNLKSLGHK